MNENQFEAWLMEEFDMSPDEIMDEIDDGVVTVKCTICGEFGRAEPDAETAWCNNCGIATKVVNPGIEILGVCLW